MALHTGGRRVREIGRDELQEVVAARTAIVVDGLPAAPYRARHLPGALNLTHEDAPAAAAQLLPDRTAAIVVYSTDESCDRGPRLAEKLAATGYDDVRLYRAGITDWVAAGLPVEASD